MVVGEGMGIKNQLGLISVYACCSTRVTTGLMEDGEGATYGRHLPERIWTIFRQNYGCWILKKADLTTKLDKPAKKIKL